MEYRRCRIHTTLYQVQIYRQTCHNFSSWIILEPCMLGYRYIASGQCSIKTMLPNILTLCLASPKSHNLTSKWLFIKILWLFMSLWTMPCLCKKYKAYKICIVILVLSFYWMTAFFLCRRSYKVPYLQYSMIIHRAGGIVMAPIKSTIFGCLYRDNIDISLLNSLINS